MKTITVQVSDEMYSSLLILKEAILSEDQRADITIDIADQLIEDCIKAVK